MSRFALALLGGLYLAGCSDTATAGAKDVALSVRVGAPAVPVAGVQRMALTLPTGIELDRVRVILREIELESDADDGSDDSSGPGSEDSGEGEDSGGDENEVEFGPVFLDLGPDALAGSMIENVVAIPVPAGTYDELKFKIGPIAARPDDEPAKAELTQAGLSLLIEGTIDGEAFTLASGVEIDQERDVHITVGDAGALENVTLFIDADLWFFDATTGERLDPRDDLLEILANIRRSIHAEDDDDQDGVGDDDDEDDNEDHSDEDEDHDREAGRDGGMDDDEDDRDEDGDGGNSGPG